MFNINFPEWDQRLFIYLNGKSHPWLDQIMIILSTYTAWFVVFALLVGIMIYRNKQEGKIAAIFLIGGITMNLLLNNLIKLAFMRPRPGHEETLKDLINQLEEVGNSYSFFSAHSSTSVCMAVFTILYFKNKLYSFVIFAWAIAVAYSRIYVGKHYPLDVVVGILFGLLTGWGTYWLYTKYGRKQTLLNDEELSDNF